MMIRGVDQLLERVGAHHRPERREGARVVERLIEIELHVATGEQPSGIDDAEMRAVEEQGAGTPIDRPRWRLRATTDQGSPQDVTSNAITRRPSRRVVASVRSRVAVIVGDAKPSAAASGSAPALSMARRLEAGPRPQLRFRHAIRSRYASGSARDCGASGKIQARRLWRPYSRVVDLHGLGEQLGPQRGLVAAVDPNTPCDDQYRQPDETPTRGLPAMFGEEFETRSDSLGKLVGFQFFAGMTIHGNPSIENANFC